MNAYLTALVCLQMTKEINTIYEMLFLYLHNLRCLLASLKSNHFTLNSNQIGRLRGIVDTAPRIKKSRVKRSMKQRPSLSSVAELQNLGS